MSSVDVMVSLVVIAVLVVDASDVVMELMNEAVDVVSAEDSVVEPVALPVVAVGVSEVVDESPVVAQGSGRSSALNVRAEQPSTIVGPWRTRPEPESQM